MAPEVSKTFSFGRNGDLTPVVVNDNTPNARAFDREAPNLSVGHDGQIASSFPLVEKLEST